MRPCWGPDESCSARCTALHRAAGPAARPALRVHGHVQSLAWLAQSSWPACPVAVTQAFHLQDGADGSHRLLTPPWGHEPPVAATPKLIQVQT